MTHRQSSLRIAALLAPAVLSACTSGTGEDQPAPIGEAPQAIIGGAPAADATYAAVGALVLYFPDFGVVDVFCSGTLVAPKAITTARHCTPSIDQANQSGLIPAFAIGQDAFNPSAVIPITGYVNAPPAPLPENGLLDDGGRDVAVAYLESAPAGVTPAKLGVFEEKMVGTTFDIAGYGVNSAQFLYGQRFAGRATARATSGRWYQLLFNNKFNDFKSWYFTDSPGAQRTEAEAKAWWNGFKLESKFELLAGGLQGEAVACHGDSGGPLLKGTSASKLTTYGVSFAVEGSISSACAMGGGYAVFNRTMLDFVKKAL